MTEKEIAVEVERLAKLYHQRKVEFARASRIRWILSFVGFALVFFLILIKGDIKTLFGADIKSVITSIIVCIVATGFYFFINISIFGWLFQKDIAEGRRLDGIVDRVREIEKNLQ